MKVRKIEEFEDEDGLKKRIIFQNNIEEITLIKPSQRFINTKLRELQKNTLLRQRKDEREILIQKKIREIAIRELEKENGLAGKNIRTNR